MKQPNPEVLAKIRDTIDAIKKDLGPDIVADIESKYDMVTGARKDRTSSSRPRILVKSIPLSKEFLKRHAAISTDIKNILDKIKALSLSQTIAESKIDGLWSDIKEKYNLYKYSDISINVTSGEVEAYEDK